MNVWEIVASILAGIAVCIPLAVKLVQYVREAVRAKNYPALVSLVTDLMRQAEAMFEKGPERKTWVLKMVEASARTVNFDIDLNIAGDMIDALCEMARTVNGPGEAAE